MQRYFLSVVWFLLSLVTSAANDVISKYLGSEMSSLQITFFRFFFGVVSLVPFVIYFGKDSLRTSNVGIHFIRGLLLFLGIASWTYGVIISQVTIATTLSFTIPIFLLVLAAMFLDEKVIWQRWLATLGGFIGIIITLNPQSNGFDPWIFVFVFACLCFAGLDTLNKKFIVKESMIGMLFYSSLFTAALALIPALFAWKSVDAQSLGLLALLGCGANLILFFILKAFSLVDATALAPYRYFELLISGIMSYCVFGDLPSASVWYGALIIIPSTMFLIYSEKRNSSKR